MTGPALLKNLSIQHRIFLLFTAMAAIIVTTAGLMLRHEVQQSLEAELGRKLQAVAQAAAVHFSEEERGIIASQPGPRLSARVSRDLTKLQQSTGVKRIYWFSSEHRALADTDSLTPFGSPYFHLQFHASALALLAQKKSSASRLFQGIDGNPTMTGFAPLTAHGRYLGGVAVDGSVPFLSSMQALERRLLALGMAALLLAMFMAWWLARTLSRPISALCKQAKSIGQGHLDRPIPSYGSGELALLSTAMEEMRCDLADREKTMKAMLAGVAHEIRNPLSGMGLFAGLLGDTLTEESTAMAHLNRIQGEIHQIQRIVNHFLDFARPHPPQAESILLRPLITEAVELTGPESASRIHIQADAHIQAHCDPGHLRQILINLIDNALQAGPQRDPVTLSVKTGHDHGIAIRICDTGPGMSREVAAQIFTPFFTTRAQGTGLGLAIARNLAQQNHGSLRMLRTGNAGTIFEITLPSPNTEERIHAHTDH